MTIKQIATATALLITTGSFAQDKIFQSDGNVIRGRVITVNSDNVVYRDWNNMNGAELTIDKNHVDKVKYENGRVEWFSHYKPSTPRERVYYRRRLLGGDEARMRSNKMNFGTSILSFAPLHTTESGLGLAVSFEKGIDKGGIVSFILPVSAVFTSEEYYTGYGNNRNYDNYMLYFSPGLKFYPTTSFGKLKYALGPTLTIGTGQQTRNNQPLYSSYYEPVQQNQFLLGAMLVNYFNVSPSNHVYLGVDFGFGFSYLNLLGGETQEMRGLTQFSFKIGYRL